MSMKSVKNLKTITRNVRGLVEGALEETGGLLRLAPCWVPRSFLQPGKRLKLHPDDLYAFGLNRGGIDERWFASTTPAANENRTPDEGLSYVVVGRQRFTLQAAIAESGATIIGKRSWWAGKANPNPIIFRRSIITWATTFPTPSWAWSPERPKPRCGVVSKTGTRETMESSTFRARTASSPGPAGSFP